MSKLAPRIQHQFQRCIITIYPSLVDVKIFITPTWRISICSVQNILGNICYILYDDIVNEEERFGNALICPFEIWNSNLSWVFLSSNTTHMTSNRPAVKCGSHSSLWHLGKKNQIHKWLEEFWIRRYVSGVFISWLQTCIEKLGSNILNILCPNFWF